METIQILVLVGGISKDSLNRKLFNAVRTLAPPHLSLEGVEIDHLPFFNQDLESDLPKAVRDFKERIKSAKAILFITPEYNRSFPAVLKNAIDWGSRPYGQSEWNQKPCAVMGASVGNVGTFGAQHHLRQTLAYLNMPTMGQPEFYLNGSKSFDEAGKLIDEKTKSFIQKYLQSFEEWLLTQT